MRAAAITQDGGPITLKESATPQFNHRFDEHWRSGHVGSIPTFTAPIRDEPRHEHNHQFTHTIKMVRKFEEESDTRRDKQRGRPSKRRKELRTSKDDSVSAE